MLTFMVINNRDKKAGLVSDTRWYTLLSVPKIPNPERIKSLWVFSFKKV